MALGKKQVGVSIAAAVALTLLIGASIVGSIRDEKETPIVASTPESSANSPSESAASTPPTQPVSEPSRPTIELLDKDENYVNAVSPQLLAEWEYLYTFSNSYKADLDRLNAKLTSVSDSALAQQARQELIWKNNTEANRN